MSASEAEIDAAWGVMFDAVYARSGRTCGDPASLREDVTRALNAAIPLVRERLARGVEAERPEMNRSINVTAYRDGKDAGMIHAARIIRGGLAPRPLSDEELMEAFGERG